MALNEDLKTVGATGRNYSTISGWESDTDDNLVSGTVSPVGVCYDDDDFNESPTFAGETSNSNYYRRLTVAEGERHDGTSWGAGVIITGGDVYLGNYCDFFELEWVIVKQTGTSVDALLYVNYITAGESVTIRNVVVDNGGYYALVNNDGGLAYTLNVENSVFITRRGGGRVIYMDDSSCTPILTNCTVYTAESSYGVYHGTCYNVLSVVSSNNYAFYGAGGDYNAGGSSAGSDVSAPGANSVDNQSPAVFVDTTDGAEDLHLVSDVTDISGAGDYSKVIGVDIDGDTWENPPDIGADQYAAGSPATGKPTLYYVRQAIGQGV